MNIEKYESVGATVWGFDGQLIGGEERIIHVMPFLRETDGTFTVINPVGSVRAVFHNEKTVFEFGTHIEPEQPLAYVPDTALVVVGPRYVEYVSTLVSHNVAIQEWLNRFLPIQNDFMVMLATINEYVQCQHMLGETAMQVFDTEFVRHNGATVSPEGYHALMVLKESHFGGEMEYFIRKLVDLKFKYEESLLLTGIRAKMSPNKLRGLVNTYIRNGKMT